MAEKDTASRKWQLTFNNPLEHGWTHEKIQEVLRTFKTMCYWCMADEIGVNEQTPHTHLFINLSPSNCRFSTLKSKFPGAHIEKAMGTSQENRDYIKKEGKWKDTDWRDLTVTYLFGKTGSGKTRSVMDKYGYANCYRVTDYKHPFDTYDGQDVIIFEEFRGGLKHGDMLNYLDGYPLLLPCRYFNRQACYTKVFIITNVPPDSQYMNIDLESRQAFYRRIHRVVRFWDDGRFSEYPSVDAYLSAVRWVKDSDAAALLDASQLSL